MCYESEVCCKFTCGHGCCKECTKSWYMKGKTSCPMCRTSICFRGMMTLKKQWYREKQEQTYKNLVTLIFDELMEEYSDIVLQCLEVVQNRYKHMMLKHPNISCEDLDIILRMVWINIDHLMNNPIENIYEPRTFEKYLMVSKYQKKMSVHYNEVEKQTNYNVYSVGCCTDFSWYVYQW